MLNIHINHCFDRHVYQIPTDFCTLIEMYEGAVSCLHLKQVVRACKFNKYNVEDEIYEKLEKVNIKRYSLRRREVDVRRYKSWHGT